MSTLFSRYKYLIIDIYIDIRSQWPRHGGDIMNGKIYNFAKSFRGYSGRSVPKQHI